MSACHSKMVNKSKCPVWSNLRNVYNSGLGVLPRIINKSANSEGEEKPLRHPGCTRGLISCGRGVSGQIRMVWLPTCQTTVLWPSFLQCIFYFHIMGVLHCDSSIVVKATRWRVNFIHIVMGHSEDRRCGDWRDEDGGEHLFKYMPLKVILSSIWWLGKYSETLETCCSTAIECCLLRQWRPE